MMNRGSLRICLGILACMMLVNGPASAALLPESPTPPAKQRIATAMKGMPLQFEANQGQVDDQVKFIARGKGLYPVPDTDRIGDGALTTGHKHPGR